MTIRTRRILPFALPFGVLALTIAISGCGERAQGPDLASTAGPSLARELNVLRGGEKFYVGVLPSPTEPPKQWVERELIAEISDGWTDEQINNLWGTITQDEIQGSRFVLLRVPEGHDLEDLREQLLFGGACLSCELNYIMESPEAQQGSIPFYEGNLTSGDMVDQDAFARVNVAQAHTVSTGRGITTAIVDTGVDSSHPELSGVLSPAGWDFVDRDPMPLDEMDGIDQDGDGIIDEAAGHGTHVAGIVHAVAPGSVLLPVRALDTEGFGNAFAIAKAIRYAVLSGANVVNLSLGFQGSSRVMQEVISAASQNGVFFASAMGNQGVMTNQQFPAKLVVVTAVAATDAFDLKPSFSNFGEITSVGAPGEGIISTYLFQGYAVWSGTSMSTPFISGAAALALETNPALTPHEIRMRIETTSDPYHHESQFYQGLLGAGRLNLWQLLAPDAPQ
jgi:hypothetical protein